MDRFNAGIPGEVPRIESKNPSHAVHMHGRYDPGIVNLRARDCEIDEQPVPFPMNFITIRQKLKAGFYIDCPAIRLDRRNAIPITIGRTREDVPRTRRGFAMYDTESGQGEPTSERSC